MGNRTVSKGIWDKYREWYFKIHQNITIRHSGEWYLGSFEIFIPNTPKKPCCFVFILQAGFHMIADDRGSQVAESSAIVCDHMETHFCDRLRSCDLDRRRSQKIEPCSILCDRLRSCDHMETKVLRFAIEMYPIILLILTDDSTLRRHKARMFVYRNAHFL